MTFAQPKNPLHGLTLEFIVTELVAYYGFEALGERTDFRCFMHDPSIASSLKFLRRTPWARAKVESLYLFVQREKARAARKNARSMRRRLDAPLPDVRWPEGVAVRTFEPSDAPAVHALLLEAYRHGGGEVPPYPAWRPAFLGDSEFEAESCFLAFEGVELIGAALCWNTAFVKDLCVAERFRRRGIGTGLLAHALHHFAARGAPAVRLKVDADNERALELYGRLGFEAENV
jgi:uncharacterized protein (DUF2132 family)